MTSYAHNHQARRATLLAYILFDVCPQLRLDLRPHCTPIQDFCRHALSPTIAVTRCLPSEMRASAPLRRFPKPATRSSFFISRNLNLTTRAAPPPPPEASIAPIATSLHPAA